MKVKAYKRKKFMIFKNAYSENCFLNKKQFFPEVLRKHQSAPFGKNAPVKTLLPSSHGLGNERGGQGSLQRELLIPLSAPLQTGRGIGQGTGICMSLSQGYPRLAHKEISKNTYYSQYLLYRLSKEGSLNLDNTKSAFGNKKFPPPRGAEVLHKYHSFYSTSMEGLPGLGLGYNALNPVSVKKEKLKNVFPYRKSFFCYWLLPFVGFVYTVELPGQFFNRLWTEGQFNNVWVVGPDRGKLPVPLAQGAVGSHANTGVFTARGDYRLQSFGQPFAQNNGASQKTYTKGISAGETLYSWGLYYFASLENSLAEKGRLLVQDDLQSACFANGFRLDTKPSGHGFLLTGKANYISQNTDSYSLNYDNLYNSARVKSNLFPFMETPFNKNGVVVPDNMKFNFHLKMSFPTLLQGYPEGEGCFAVSFLESPSLKNSNNKTLLSVEKDYIKDNRTFVPNAFEGDGTLKNPISSFRKASALLDKYSKIQFNKTVFFSPKTSLVASQEGQSFGQGDNYGAAVNPDRQTSLNGVSQKRSTSGVETRGFGFKVFSPDLYEKFFSYQNLLSKPSKNEAPEGSKLLYPNLGGALPQVLRKHSKVDLSSKNSFSYLFMLEGLSQGEVLNPKDEKDHFVPKEGSKYSLLSKENLYRFLLNSFNTSASDTYQGQSLMAAPSVPSNVFLENNKLSISSVERGYHSSEAPFGIVKYSHPILMSLGCEAPTMTLPAGVRSTKAAQDPMLVVQDPGADWVNLSLKEQTSSVKVNENLFFKEESTTGGFGSQRTPSLLGSSKNPLGTKTPIQNFNDLRKSVTFYESLVKDSILLNKEWNKKPEYLQFPSQFNGASEAPFSSPSKAEAPFGSVSKIEKLLRAFFCLKKSALQEGVSPSGMEKRNTQAAKGIFLKENGYLLKDKMFKCILNMSSSFGRGQTTSLGSMYRLSHTFGTYGKKALAKRAVALKGWGNKTPLAKYPLRALNTKLKINPTGYMPGVNVLNKSWLYLSGGRDSSEGAFSPSNSIFTIKSGLAPKGKHLRKKMFSPRLLLKNRFLILNKPQRMILGLYSIGSLEENSPLFNVSKNNQKKRRLKKLKKETRRRKKRKRFYPRPIWIRYRLYQKVLKARYYLKKDKNSKKEFVILDGLGSAYNSDPLAGIRSSENQSLHNKLYRNYQTLPTGRFEQNTLAPIGGFSLNGMVQNYKISPSVRGDLKRALWKSYWLRSNLNTYLNKVENALNGIEQSKKSSEYLSSLRKFISEGYFLGFNIDNYNSASLGSLNKTEEYLKQGYSSKNNISAFMGQVGPHSEEENFNKWQTALYLAEYNRVSYVRIQQFISQIRENLTLNGQVKPHSRKISPLIHSITQTTKRSSAKDSGFILNPERLRKISSLLNGIPQSRISMPSTSQSQRGFYWAFSKTSYGEFNEYNKTRKKWNATKNREQTKNNKTKKIYKEIQTKLQNFLNERSFLLSSVQALALGTTTTTTTTTSNTPIEVGQSGVQSTNVSNQSLNTLPKDASQRLYSFVYGSKSNTPSATTSSLLPKNDQRSFPSASHLGENLGSLWGQGFDSLSESERNIQGGNENILGAQGPVRLVKLLENALRKTRMKEEKSQILGYSKSFLKVPNNIFVENDSNNSSNEHYTSRYSTLTSKSSFWWSASKSPFGSEADTFYERGYFNKEGLELPGLTTQGVNYFLNENNVSRLWISALLFHFCAILSILSISQIRGLLKIYLYAISKIYKTSLQILGLALSSFSRIILFQPKTSQSSPRSTGFEVENSPGQSPQPDMLLRRGNILLKKNGKHSSGKKSFSFLNLNKKRNSTFGEHSANSWNGGYSTEGYSSTGYTYDLGSFGRNFYTFTQSLNKSSSNQDLGNTGAKLFGSPTGGETSTPELNKYPLIGPESAPEGAQSNYQARSKNLFLKTLYLFIWTCLKKPIYFYKKSNRSLGAEPQVLSRKPLSQSVKEERSKNAKHPLGLERFKTSTTLRSLVLMNLLIDNSFNFYSKTASVLKETKLVLFEGSLRYIYSFLEKPGELIVDWIAYLFLVEWASDITNTIPENIDYVLGHTSYKITRNLYFQNAYTVFDLVKTPLQISDISKSPSFFNFFNIGRSFIQHRIYHLYEILLLIFYQPDTDLIVRQKKGVIFWDIWGDYLKVVAEDSNINISELTSVKEEQIKLLSKCETFNPGGGNDRFGSFGEAVIDPLNPIFTWHRLRSSKVVEKAYPSLNFIASSLTKEKFGPNSLAKDQVIGSRGLSAPSGNRNNDWNLKNANLGPLFTEGDTRFLGNQSESHYASWGAQQFLSYQGKDTELFIDLHPRGALEQLCLLKDNSSIIQPIGSLVCQIFSGLLSKQISKNMLVVGSYNNRIEKTLLVQAIAGETELKIVVDSAYRYAMVYRGVAVGIKLLRDVFDSLVATGPPCLFLIEDIHAIGERRPMLISDDENSVKEGFTGALSEEIHEKNQVLYSLSKHMITHYKKPYKGDFSLLIPTNLYSFDFFLGLSSREGNNIYPSRKHPVSPPLSLKEKESSDSFERKRQEIGGSQKSAGSLGKNPLEKNLSRLLIKSSELLAPPATSPFSVLTLKEEKKFKPTKLVSEMPWAGLPGEQYASLISSKASYSIRVKVALLADMAISSLSVKLDMITDLLVIIDSVKGNRGFVVFATTHVPYILDPALRRPGRFDETISLGLFPTVFSRWEVLKSSFATLHSGFSPLQSYGLSFDFSLYLKSGFNFRNLQNMQSTGEALSPLYINQTRRILFNSISGISGKNFNKAPLAPENSKLTLSRTEAGNSPLGDPQYMAKGQGWETTYYIKKPLKAKLYPQKRKLLSQTYYLASLLLFKTHQNSKSQLMGCSAGLLDLTPGLLHENSRFISLYASPQEFKNHSIHYIVGKLGEIFLETSSCEVLKVFPQGCFPTGRDPGGSPTGIYSTFGLSNTMQSLTSLILSFIHKRFIYHKNLIVPQFLDFSNSSSLFVPSSPPSSSILLPAKRYENYRRSFAFFTQKRKTSIGILEKINLHQQQRLVKRLYRLPVKESFRSEIIENRFTGFSNAALMIGSYEKLLQNPSSSNMFVRNRIFMRHQNYLTNQWWNGQLPEHNAETTYLSDIDWRYTFIESIGDLLFDFPDADIHYSPRNRRWLLTKGSYQQMFSFDKTLYSEIYSHFIFESFTKAFHIFEENREVLDFYAFYILKKGLYNVKPGLTSLTLFQRLLN